MSWNFNNNSPIFCQIQEIITLNILSGKYLLGQKLPTVRDLAITAGVNPNTMQRALSEVENQGLIYTKRGDGRYVVEDKEILKSESGRLLAIHVKDFVNSLKDFGLDKEEILFAVKEQLERGENT